MKVKGYVTRMACQGRETKGKEKLAQNGKILQKNGIMTAHDLGCMG